MKSIEDFLSTSGLSLPPVALRSKQSVRRLPLPEGVRQSANRGWRIFPVTQLGELTRNSDLLIGEATCDIFRLEELAAEYRPTGWRVAIGPSQLCVLQLDGQQGKCSFAALIQEHGECFTTLQARRGDMAWAFFRWPTGLVLRSSAKKLAAGVRMLGDGYSCAVPPYGGSVFTTPWAEVEAVPHWLRDLAFETPDTPPGKAAPVPAFSPRPARCRSRAQFPTPPQLTRKGYPVRGQTGCRGRYRISRRR